MPKRQAAGLEFIVLISMITALTALSIDALLPVLREIGSEFGRHSVGETQALISLFILGMVFGEIAFGPLSDAYGRVPIILAGLAIYIAACIAAIAATNFEMLITARIVMGFAVAAAKIAVRALIRDLYAGEEMARILSLIFMVFIAVPMLAPLIGQEAAKLAGWRAIFFLYMVWGLLAACWLWLRQPETLMPEARIKLHPALLFRNATLILSHRPVMYLTIAMGLIFGTILLFLGVAQSIFTELYGQGGMFVWWFAFLASAIGLTSLLNSRLVQRFGAALMAKAALAAMGLAGLVQTILIIWLDGTLPFLMFLAAHFVIFGCFGLLFGNLQAIAMRWLGQIAGLGNSITAAGSSLIAALFSIAIAQFYAQNLMPLALIYFGNALICLLLLHQGLATPADPINPAREMA